MAIITVNNNGNHYRVTSAAYDSTMNRYLPASPQSLRLLCEERSDCDYSEVTDVSVFLAMLADWNYNTDEYAGSIFCV